MTAAETVALLRRVYAAYAAHDVAELDAVVSENVVLHVPGDHPLSGAHCGRDAMWDYLGRVSAVAGGRGGFDVRSIIADERGHAAASVFGTIRHFVRPMVHVWRAQDGVLTEFREINLDQDAEDAFWNRALTIASDSCGPDACLRPTDDQSAGSPQHWRCS
ncbi:MAG: uncharacterized protein QOJ79_2232 [Actinomycetota bacterium]|jgi:ketosteroid isomerase-like protein|nr:uncharacterized protein [Actinomycetota bacterium]